MLSLYVMNLCFSLRSLLLVLSLGTAEKSLAPSFEIFIYINEISSQKAMDDSCHPCYT